MYVGDYPISPLDGWDDTAHCDKKILPFHYEGTAAVTWERLKGDDKCVLEVIY